MFLVVEYFSEMCIIIIYFHFAGPIYIIISQLRLGGYVGFCGGGDGFVGFCGLLVEVSVVGWWVWQRWWLVERERERERERESKYKCNLFLLGVYGGGFVGCWWWSRRVEEEEERERVNVNSIFFLLGIDGGFEGCW